MSNTEQSSPALWKRALAQIDAEDVLGITGVALLAYGAWLAWHPAGFMVGGLAMLSGPVTKTITAFRGPRR